MVFRAQSVRRAVLLLALGCARVGLATETDQFTTPRGPLHDLGPALSRKVVEVIEADSTGRDPERILAEWAGRNMLSSRPAAWVKEARVEAAFRPGLFGSIYRSTFSPVPATFLFDSPTVNLHGFYLGTDKIDHFFRQGHEYYRFAMGAGGPETTEAIAAAVARGVKQEHSFLGTLASGVYSNADLAANFAGMKFYLNLRRPVRLGGRVSPPLFEPAGEGWRLRAGVEPERLLKPFLSNHLDESLNPSRYRFNRGAIRSRIRERCPRWTEFYADRLELVAPSGLSFAKDWFGEDYGHWLPPGEEVSIATECSGSRP